jgi:hypothetical protein
VQYNFTGWIIGWHRTSGKIVEKYTMEGGPEDTRGGGVWMSGGGISQDSGRISPPLVVIAIVISGGCAGGNYNKNLVNIRFLCSWSHVLRHRKRV